jgi:hypothetical protein
VALLAIGLTCGPALNAQQRGAPAEYRLRFNAIYFDNFFRAYDGQPRTPLWGNGAECRVAVPIDRLREVRLYADVDAIRLPGLQPTYGVGVGVQEDRKPSTFDMNVSYLWNRPTVETGDRFGRADMVRFHGEGGYRPFGTLQIIGRTEFRREWYALAAVKNSIVFEFGPAVRFSAFGYRLSPEIGLAVGKFETRDPNEAYGERTLLVGASSLLWRSRLYVAARYRDRMRTYGVAGPHLSNFGRIDRHRELTGTLAIAVWRWLSWTAYYARERGRSPRQWGNFTTQLVSVGVATRF